MDKFHGKLHNTPGANPQDCPFLKAHPIIENSSGYGVLDSNNGSLGVEDSNNRKCFFVELKQGASFLNLFSFYLVQFSYVCFFCFMDIMQPHLLDPNEKYITGLSSEDQEQANTDLVFYDNLYLIVFISIFGAFHDVIGRKLVCSIGFLLISISMFLYPFAGSVYPQLLLIRLIFSNGICAVVTQPLLADYVKHTSKGFCGGISALLSGLGALFAVFGLMKLHYFMSYGSIYIVTACFSLFVSIFCLFGVKNMNIVSINQNKSCGERMKSIVEKLSVGFKELKSNTKLIFGVVTNVQARFNSIIITIILSLWVRRFYEDKAEALNRTLMISGIGSTVGMISAVLFGFCYDKAKIKNLLVINNLCILIGYVSLLFWNSPKKPLMLISFALSFFGFYGLTTVGFVIISKNVGCSARGAVMGLNSLFGAIGIVIMMKVGGFLFNKVWINIPFMISAGVSLIVLILINIPSISQQLEDEVDAEEIAETNLDTTNPKVLTEMSSELKSSD